jgi:hypothetical protein
MKKIFLFKQAVILNPIYFLLIVCISLFSCTKEKHIATTLPESVNFEFLGKDGKSLITSLKDSVKISFTENGITKFHNLVVTKFYVANSFGPDTTKTVAKYNGLIINDGRFMSNLSSRTPNPIRDFNIYLNGVNMGTIYLDYWGYQDAYPNLLSNNLKFNNIQVQVDFNPNNFVQGSPANLLQVQ